MIMYVGWVGGVAHRGDRLTPPARHGFLPTKPRSFLMIHRERPPGLQQAVSVASSSSSKGRFFDRSGVEVGVVGERGLGVDL